MPEGIAALNFGGNAKATKEPQRTPDATPVSNKSNPAETRQRHPQVTRCNGDAPIWRAAPGRKTAGGQVNFRLPASAMALLTQALQRFDVDQTTLMTTAFLEFCDRYEVK